MTDTLPLISPWTGFTLAGLTSASYVAAVYFSSLIASPKPPLGRNHPDVIRARSICAMLSTAGCCVAVYLTISSRVQPNQLNEKLDVNAISLTLAHLGLPTTLNLIPLRSLRSYLIIPLLFLGPLYTQLLELSSYGSVKDRVKQWKEQFWGWIGFRNFILAPVTEEVTYRACVLSFYNLAGASRRSMIWAAPCWFGLAHVHHGLEVYKTQGRNGRALKLAVGSVVFQFAYTTMFGWICSFLFMRTGSLGVVTLSHAFCNAMGFPMIFDDLKHFPAYRTSIIGTHLLGIVLFAYTLYPWSYNPNSVYWP